MLAAGKTTVEQRAAIAELDRIARGEASCGDMAELARRFLPLVTEPAVWTARIDALPAARILPPPGRDWDAIIGDGEATLSTVSGRYHRHVAQPLAVA
ncbi:hypothetical protein OV079_23960 [Nannocystis pusilla]|uniref:Uncharacterized protein n=1 Tax=Nannocystis pusilla TaxID=889268 RepID=A0A9X3ESG8_9BACT|nr:hypothetical protein [Nannocystis pusilla]MCY1008559.1 hypothetical protein [Nannocystis pusilla]